MTYALLCLVLMAKLGINAETQLATLDQPQIRYALHEFKKSLSGKSEPKI